MIGQFLQSYSLREGFIYFASEKVWTSPENEPFPKLKHAKLSTLSQTCTERDEASKNKENKNIYISTNLVDEVR